MITTRKNQAAGGRRLALALVLVAGVFAPALTRGDVVLLKDGSTLKGRVLSLAADTLTMRTTFGAEVRVPRSKLAQVSFTDSLVVPVTGGVAPAPGRVPSGTGTIAVTFADRGVSSKIAAKARGDQEPYLHANWIEMRLLVDDQVVYTQRDTTMDKVIYNGPERLYKNEIELEDFEVDVPAGPHHARIVVTNVGADDYAAAFDTEPLNMVLNLDNMEVPADRNVRVRVGIKRGKLRLGKPKLVRLD
jgi:hypothetical protein